MSEEFIQTLRELLQREDRLYVYNTKKWHSAKKKSKGCPQDSAFGPGFWGLQYNSLLNLEYTKNTKAITYADNLMILVK